MLRSTKVVAVANNILDVQLSGLSKGNYIIRLQVNDADLIVRKFDKL
ncbi:hypothetical protein BH09BAC2_BH09BAC2_19090 [soil metagenome]